MTALEQAFARIDANAAADQALAARKAADSRLAYLTDLGARLKHQGFADGSTGGLQMFAYVLGAANAQELRVGALIAARGAQVGGFHADARRYLARAAKFRLGPIRRAAVTETINQRQAA